jgi:U3 small nucleolar RNA-associated protein 3
MAKKKSRHTAKTGDQKIYQSRGLSQGGPTKKHQRKVDDDDDNEKDVVDRFVDESYLKLDADDDDEHDEDDDSILQEEGVMDLGIHDEDDTDEDDDESASSDPDDESVDSAPTSRNARRPNQRATKTKDSEEGDENTEDDDDEQPEGSSDDDSDQDDHDSEDDVRDWGRKKAAYYHGDTGDLEIGQDQEDAYLEEEAAKEVQAARYKEMSEDDYYLDGQDGAQQENDDKAMAVGRDTTKLSLKDQRKVLNKQHPEMLPLLSYFSSVVDDLKSNTGIATSALLLDGEPGTAEVRVGRV